MAYFTIALTTRPNSEQSFKLTLEGGKRNINIKLRLRYMDLCDYWLADITDNDSGEELISSLPLVCGADLLGQFEHLKLGHAWVVKVEPTELQMPDNEALGSTFLLIWGDDT